MNYFRKILATNSINVIGIFLSTYFYGVINAILSQSLTLFQILIGILISIILYGMIFWLIFFIGILLLDFILISKSRKNLKQKLYLEWLIISLPFFYWIFQHQEWIFLVATISFLITQTFREAKILKIQKGFV